LDVSVLETACTGAVDTLSGGEQQRVALPARSCMSRGSCSLMSQPGIWIQRQVAKIFGLLMI